MTTNYFKKLALACCVALFTMPAMAQKTKNAMFDAFEDFTSKLIKDRQTTMVMNNNYGDGYIQEYHFKTVPATVKKFDETMMDNAKDAYSSFMKAEGVDAQGDTSVSIGYGENSKATRQITYKRDNNYNVQFFHDAKNKNKRYAYALVWKKEGEKAVGYALKIYGQDPKAQLSIIEETKLTDKPTNSQQFMQAFSNLRSIYVKQNDEVRRDLQWQRAFDHKTSDKLPLLTAIANKIAILCGNYGNLLNTTDYQLVRQTLKEMQQEASNRYVGKLLGATYENMSNIIPKP